MEIMKEEESEKVEEFTGTMKTAASGRFARLGI